MMSNDPKASPDSKSSQEPQASPVNGESSAARSSFSGILRRKQILIPLAVLFVLIASATWFYSQTTSRLHNASSEPDPMAGDRPEAPALELTSTDGGKISLQSLKGKVVLIGFWASDCTTCLLELPAFEEIRKRYASEGLEVLAISLDSDIVGGKSAKDTAKEVWERGGFKTGSYLDAGRATASALKIETLPSAVVLDRQGRMAFNSYGANDWLSPETARLIEDLLLEE
ncbi:MAG: TlpA disulfide reductase family protein [Bdellovibrionales bacterium]|nr:TlpA disulfide reductase family protein [Bdellovibrionales bacterium]